jgi:hypothetical protein
LFQKSRPTTGITGAAEYVKGFGHLGREFRVHR